jgi:DNA topoisomerase-1
MEHDFTLSNPEVYYNMKTDKYHYKLNDTILPSKYVKLIKSLKIPIVYTTLWISKKPNVNLLAIALDRKGKKQYYYSKDHVSSRNGKKLEIMYRLIRKINKFKKLNELNADNMHHTKIKTMAFMIKTIELTNIRVGNKKYLDRNNSFGLATLQKKHISIKNNKLMEISFNGKHNVQQHLTITCPKTIKFIKSMLILPEDWIFKYPNTNKTEYFRISAQDLNQYLQSIIGNSFTCKDFRTYGANVIFLKTLQGLDIPLNEYQNKRNISKSITETANKLGNNKATSKGSYVSEFIIDEYTKNPEMIKKLSLEKILKLAL